MHHRYLPMTLALLSACTANSPPAPAEKPSTAPVPAAAQPAVSPPAPTVAHDNGNTAATPVFVDKVWRVERSATLEKGTTYTFLGNGTLVIDAPGGTPMIGSWRDQAGQLTMVEEGVAYPADVVAADAGHLVLRSHNPGGSVEIALVAAPDQALPTVSK
ncbi:MAG: hypothetical protein JWL98_451 [Xanthomonadaceae bacterium]|nr:hypothetical protein [Xanthomonadaceae bacterium]